MQPRISCAQGSDNGQLASGDNGDFFVHVRPESETAGSTASIMYISSAYENAFTVCKNLMRKVVYNQI